MRIPSHRPTTRLAVAAVASLALLGLSACSDDADTADSEETSAQSTESSEPTESTAPEEPTEEAETEESDAPAASGDQPEWAKPVTTPGEQIATIEAGDITVDVFQVATTKSPKDGLFADPDTNKPLIAEGDEIVFVNYVITNNGDDVDLGSSGVSVEARYDDWPYMQGMDTITGAELYAEQDVNDGAFAVGSYVEPPVYTFGAGQQVSYGENFIYQSGSPITFDVTITPVDAEGELLHDDRIEGEGNGVIS
ncbi:hypothetical protein [Nocardioides sp. 616]|uniref:hypothetical protein n=1 Tax=Nocardioides sp. 616 TaxID=2268090 RepID=UPI000CE2BABF|nr:hypothetical protein [Nocardioides sp. 616]